jgi:hypothetical protein
MGKHERPFDGHPVPGNVDNATWIGLLIAAAKSPNGVQWFASAFDNEDNAKDN